jgi:hypothetical protein
MPRFLAGFAVTVLMSSSFIAAPGIAQGFDVDRARENLRALLETQAASPVNAGRTARGYRALCPDAPTADQAAGNASVSVASWKVTNGCQLSPRL